MQTGSVLTNGVKVGLGKYDRIRSLKKTKARTFQQCDLCNRTIEPGEDYYAETQKDKFLPSLDAMRFCSKCYEKDDAQLLSMARAHSQTFFPKIRNN